MMNHGAGSTKDVFFLITIQCDEKEYVQPTPQFIVVYVEVSLYSLSRTALAVYRRKKPLKRLAGMVTSYEHHDESWC